MRRFAAFAISLMTFTGMLAAPALAQVGVGTTPPADATVLFDGTRAMLDANWTYWDGPRLKAELPIKWEIVDDPVDDGTVMSSADPAATLQTFLTGQPMLISMICTPRSQW